MATETIEVDLKQEPGGIDEVMDAVFHGIRQASDERPRTFRENTDNPLIQAGTNEVSLDIRGDKVTIDLTHCYEEVAQSVKSKFGNSKVVTSGSKQVDAEHVLNKDVGGNSLGLSSGSTDAPPVSTKRSEMRTTSREDIEGGTNGSIMTVRGDEGDESRTFIADFGIFGYTDTDGTVRVPMVVIGDSFDWDSENARDFIRLAKAELKEEAK